MSHILGMLRGSWEPVAIKGIVSAITDVVGTFFRSEHAQGLRTAGRVGAPAPAMRHATSSFFWLDTLRGSPSRLAKQGEDDLFDIGQEALAVDWPVERRLQSSLAGEARKEHRRLPMAVRHIAEGACADIDPGATTRYHASLAVQFDLNTFSRCDLGPPSPLSSIWRVPGRLSQLSSPISHHHTR